MPLIDIAVARRHLRVEADYPAEQIQPYLAAAEDAAQQFLNRLVVVDQDALVAALAAIPAALDAAAAARTLAIEAAQNAADAQTRCVLVEQAQQAYVDALAAARRAGAGIVINPSIAAGIQLTLGHLFEHREDVASVLQELPQGAKSLLWPYRVGLGV